jgi:hypothetical protein
MARGSSAAAALPLMKYSLRGAARWKYQNRGASLLFLIDKHGMLQEVVPMGDRWTGGKMVLTPATATQSKEIPIETFFHKIVMVRDRLRVLEQNINSHPRLNDEDRVNLQQYITRIYGSLTTFNVLFKDKEQYFVGSSKD